MFQLNRSKKPGRLFSNRLSKHSKVIATIEAARLADQSLFPDEEYSKLINDIPLSSTPPPDQSSPTLEGEEEQANPQEQEALAADEFDDSGKTGSIAQTGLIQSPERETVTTEIGETVPACESCHRLLGNRESDNDSEIQLVPDFYDPKFSSNEESVTTTRIWSNLKENKSWNNPCELTSLLLADSQVDPFDECSLIRDHIVELPYAEDKLPEDPNRMTFIPEHATACELSCHFLNQYISDEQDDVKLVPDFFDPFFTSKASHIAETSNGVSADIKDPLDLKLKDLKNAVEMSNYFLGTFEPDRFDDVTLTVENLIETPSIKPMKDPYANTGSPDDRQEEDSFKGPAYALSSYLLSRHTWVVDDEIQLVPSDAYGEFNPNSEQKTGSGEGLVLSKKLSVPNKWDNASELSNLIMNGSKVDFFENCTLLMDTSSNSNTEENKVHESATERDADRGIKPGEELTGQAESEWKTAAELCNLLLAKVELEILTECDLLPKDSIDVYMGTGCSEGTSEEEDALQRQAKKDKSCGSACNLSSALMELHGLKAEDDTQFIPRLHLPEVKVQQTAATGGGIVKRESSTEQEFEKSSKAGEVDAHERTKAELGTFNNLVLVLEGNLDLYTGGSESPGSVVGTDVPRHLFCGPGLRCVKPNKRRYLEDAVFIPDFFDPSVLSKIEKRIPNEEGSNKIKEVNMVALGMDDEVSDRLLTEARLAYFNKYTVVLDSKLDLCTESCPTHASSTEGELAKDVSLNEKAISKRAPVMAGYLIDIGLSNLGDDVSLVSENMEDYMASPSGVVSNGNISEGDEPTTLYEAILVPGLKAPQIGDQVIQYIGFPSFEEYGLVGDMELASPSDDPCEYNEMSNQTEQQDELGTQNLPLGSVCGAAQVDQKGSEKHFRKEDSSHAAELADKISVTVEIPSADAVSLIQGLSSLSSAKGKMSEAPINPSSTQTTSGRVSKSGTSAAEIACFYLNQPIKLFDSNTTLINNFNDLLDYSYPTAAPTESTDSNELNFVPVSADEIATRIDNTLGCSTWEELRLVANTTGTKVQNKATALQGVSYRAPDVASMLLDQGIAVFDGDTPFVQQLNRPVGQCVVDRSFTLEISLKKAQTESKGIHTVNRKLRDAKGASLPYNPHETNVQTLNAENLYPVSRVSEKLKILEKPLTPSQVKIVRIRRRKSAEQENIMTTKDSWLPISEKRIKYYTTREVQLDFVRPQNHSSGQKFNRSKSVGKNDRISVTWNQSMSKPSNQRSIPIEKSVRSISPLCVKNNSEPGSLKRMNGLDDLPPINYPSKTSTPEVLHIYTSQSIFSVRTSITLEDNRRNSSHTSASIHMDITSPVHFSNETLCIPQPFESPLPYKVYTDDEDSEKSTVSSRSGYFIEVKK